MSKSSNNNERGDAVGGEHGVVPDFCRARARGGRALRDRVYKRSEITIAAVADGFAAFTEYEQS